MRVITADLRVPPFWGMNISSQSRYMYKKENYQQPVMGHIVWKKWIQFALNCFNNHTGSTCSQIFTHPYQSTCKMQKQSHKELNPGYENIFISHFCRVSYNVLCQIQGYIFFVKNGPQCKNYMGGGGVHGGNSMIRLNPLCFPRYPLTHIKVHIRCKNNQYFFSFNLKYKNNEYR